MCGNAFRRGFTLVELLVVLALIGLLAGLASMRFGGLTQRAKLEWTVDRIVAADRGARMASGAQGRGARLHFDLDHQRIERISLNREDNSTLVAFDGRVSLAELRLVSGRIRSGDCFLDYSPNGGSPTFAAEIAAPSGGSSWLLFAGSSGQLTRLEDGKDVDAIFQALAKQDRPDAR